MEHENFRKNPVRVVGHSEPPNPGATGGFTIALFVIDKVDRLANS